MTGASEAAVSVFMRAGGIGATCAGGPTGANFATGGPPVEVLVCVSAPVEPLCGITYRLQAASGEGSKFNVLSRTASTAFSALDGPSTFAVVPIVNPAAGINLGGGTASNVPALPANNQLVATLQLSPAADASNNSYVLNFDSASVVGIDDGTGDCSLPGEQAISAAITLNRALPPAFISASSVTLTVGFSGNFMVEATGSPVPTYSIMGSLPIGMSFTPASGLISGTPALGTVAGSPYMLTFTASNGNLPNPTQNFTLNVQKANQAINFAPISDRAFSAAPFAISATATSNLTMTFSSSTTNNCTIAGNSLTMIAVGTCTIVANQTGDGNYNPAAPISQSFQITGMGPFSVTPSAGANGTISPSLSVAVNSGATTSFTVTPNAGFVASVGGTCGGTLVINMYTTSAITAPCTVIATFVPLITYNVVLEGAQETPPNAATGTGSGTAVVDTVNNKIALNLAFSGMTGALNGSHLHGPAVRGSPAGVKIGIGVVSPITDTVTYSEMDEADILAGRWYVNLHTAANGGGEIRGQLDNLGAANKVLNVAIAGTGSGSVTGTGINCPGDCAETVPHNTVIALTATPNGGSTFTGWSGACGGTSACNVTMNFLKSVTATFTQNTFTVTPSVLGMGSISPSMAQTVNQGATVMFTVTPAMGFNANVTGTCGGNLAGATFTTNPISANCTVIVTFSAPLALVRVESRKVHGAFTCNVLVDRIEPIGGNITTEPRDNGNGQLVVFVFDDLVTSFTGVTVAPVGTPSPSTNGNELLVTLTGIPDNSRVTVSVNGVNGAINESASVGFMTGDVSNSRTINAADISAAKAQLNQAVSIANCRADINADGQIKPSDVSAVKSRSGRVLQ